MASVSPMKVTNQSKPWVAVGGLFGTSPNITSGATAIQIVPAPNLPSLSPSTPQKPVGYPIGG